MALGPGLVTLVVTNVVGVRVCLFLERDLSGLFWNESGALWTSDSAIQGQVYMGQGGPRGTRRSSASSCGLAWERHHLFGHFFRLFLRFFRLLQQDHCFLACLSVFAGSCTV